MGTAQDCGYGETVRKFYEAYGRMKEYRDLALRTSADLRGNNCIRIHENGGAGQGRLVFQVERDSILECYQKATEYLEQKLREVSGQ